MIVIVINSYKKDRQNNLRLLVLMSEGGYGTGLKNMWHGYGR